jgi:hypothetical protein
MNFYVTLEYTSTVPGARERSAFLGRFATLGEAKAEVERCLRSEDRLTVDSRGVWRDDNGRVIWRRGFPNWRIADCGDYLIRIYTSRMDVPDYLRPAIKRKEANNV